MGGPETFFTHSPSIWMMPTPLPSQSNYVGTPLPLDQIKYESLESN